MVSGNRSAWRRRRNRNRVARIALPLGIPVALSLVVVAVVAFTNGGHSASISQTALGAQASASPSASAAPTSTATSATGTTTTTAVANVSCDIIVPANPLSAQGLATPYQLTGPGGMSPAQSGCNMANAANLGAFVQATILNTQTGQLSVYNPLVITKGTTPAVAPVVPVLPRRYVATIDFGFNGTNLTLVGATRNALRNGLCVNGLNGSIFGQVAFCNGINFFAVAHRMEAVGTLVVPAEGTSTKIVASGGALGGGQNCPVTQNFDMIDQDQSDNVTSLYLLNPATGQTAQDTAANAGNIPGSQTLANGSDNILLDGFIDPTLGCTPFQAPDLTNNGQMTSSQAMDELLAERNPPTPAALVPENDEMTLVNGRLSVSKTDLYRAELGQERINGTTNRVDNPAAYCQNMVNIQTAFLAANQATLSTGPSPVPGVGNNLFTFMANRLNMSFTNLGCQNFGLTNPVTVTVDGNGAATAATFSTTVQTAKTQTGGMPSTGQRTGRPHHHLMNPSGM